MTARPAPRLGRLSRRAATALFAAGLTVLGVVALPGAASAQQDAADWAPAATAAIHPGVQSMTEGGQCTTNFVFRTDARVFIGQAAHCAGTGGATDTNGCATGSLPLGTPVTITGASKPGTLVYSSWITMAERGEADPSTCMYNDLALVELDAADVGKVNPSVPYFGGPTGLDTDGTKLGEQIFSYQNSSLRLGLTALSPKVGLSTGDAGGGWSHDVVTLTPGVPGDSGSGFLDAQGEAIGQLSTLNFTPVPGTNGVGDLALELAYANEHGDLGTIELVKGTQPFSPPLALPALPALPSAIQGSGSGGPLGGSVPDTLRPIRPIPIKLPIPFG